MALMFPVILKNTDPFEEEAYPLPAGCLKRFREVNIAPFGIPDYNKPNFWELIHNFGYKAFRHDVDHKRKTIGLPPLDKFHMEAAWFQRLEAKYRLYDARKIKTEKTLEQKVMLKKRAFIAAMNQVCSALKPTAPIPLSLTSPTDE
jgi:hypothetical protein